MATCMTSNCPRTSNPSDRYDKSDPRHEGRRWFQECTEGDASEAWREIWEDYETNGLAGYLPWEDKWMYETEKEMVDVIGYIYPNILHESKEAREKCDTHPVDEADVDREREAVLHSRYEKSGLALLSEVYENKPKNKARLTFIRGDQSAEGQRREYVVKGLFARGDIVSIFGAPGAGKSVIAPHIGHCIARGVPVFGRRTKPGNVFYVAVEDDLGLLARREALNLTHGVEPGLVVVQGVSSLAVGGDMGELLAAIRREKPVMVIIDTLARAFPGLMENDAAAMGLVVAVAEKIANAHEDRCCVCFVHHDTKTAGGTPRGHSVLNGALDVGLLVSKNENSGIVNGRLTKNRNGPTDLPPEDQIAFSIRGYQLGEDTDGDPITAPICLELVGDANPMPKLSVSQRAAFEVYRELAGNIPNIDREVFIEACAGSVSVTTAGTPKARRSSALRALKGLVGKGLLEADEKQVWETEAPPMFDDVGGENEVAEALK